MEPERGWKRRDLLQGSLALTGAGPLCCRTPEVDRESIRYQGSKLLLDLERAKDLASVGGAVAVVDARRGLNLIVAHSGEERYAALDRTCTHGGGQCTYNHKRQSVRCTSLNHAEYDLRGTLLHGRTHGNLRQYETRLIGTTLEVELGGAA